MKSSHNMYPIFEANQVLTNAHLNEIFNYLDQQDRLTRANLIGIGIVCGLDVRLEITTGQATIHLSKGSGVTSEGYLLVEPGDVALVSYQEYTLPAGLNYPPFENLQHSLYEMFPANEPGTTSLGIDFLKDKAVLLFLEMKEEVLRTCSPNDCNDKGSKVTSTVRRLLIEKSDLRAIIAKANGLPANLTSADLESLVLVRLRLPDIRLPRVDVPNTSMATSQEVLAAVYKVFHNNKLASTTGDALSKAYEAFKPILKDIPLTDSFATFTNKFGFLENGTIESEQVRFLQYYYDFFDDLLKAYDEFRWKGVELLCACCPQEDLFPRHLMLGVLSPASVANPNLYRHHFLASPAIGECEQGRKDLLQLFQRLVEMIARFTKNPTLPQGRPGATIDEQIRITPSKLADVPLSNKAIPYYYLQNGTPSLYKIWNPEKTRRNRDNHNLSYRSDEYTPLAPEFVRNPLRYDLEPHNFLRIEGHLGKNYRSVLNTLLTLKTRYRLPIEIIALRTGAFDEQAQVDLAKETCRLKDLEVLYDTLREELLCALCEGVKYFYGIPMKGSKYNGGIAQLPLLKKCAPNYRYGNHTIGAWYENHLGHLKDQPYIDIDQSHININEEFKVYCSLFAGAVSLSPKNYPHIISIFYFTKLAEILPSSLDKLRFADFENKYQDLIGLIRYFRAEAYKETISAEFLKYIPQEDLIDHFDQVLFSCKLEPIRAVHEEYVRRIREIKQKQFLSFFLQQHPGIQHKAGVPLGGTFILVYHEEQEPLLPNAEKVIDEIHSALTADAMPGSMKKVDMANVSDAIDRIKTDPQLLANNDVQYLVETLTGRVPNIRFIPPPTGGTKADKIIDQTVKNLTDGAVIADFFLPYLCCSNGAAIQYTLPMPPLGLSIQLNCTDPSNRTAEATLVPQGGVPPFTYQLDTQLPKPLKGKILLPVGDRTLLIRDSAGAESARQTIKVPESLSIGREEYKDDVSNKTYQVIFKISGGIPPYIADTGAVTDTQYISNPVSSGSTFAETITDDVGCTIKSDDFQHSVCDLPCDGKARRCAYLFWLPEPDSKFFLEEYEAKIVEFQFVGPQGTIIKLSLSPNITATATNLNSKFAQVVGKWINQINLIVLKESKADWFKLEYRKNDRDFFGKLIIEYFSCHKFSIKIKESFSYANLLNEVRTVAYSEKGTTVHIEGFNELPVINPFDCEETNKCQPNYQWKPLCEGTNIKIEVDHTYNVQTKQLTLIGQTDGGETPKQYLWEVKDGKPSLLAGKKVKTEILGGIEATRVRLTAFSESGCSVTIEKIIFLTIG